jgi:hypothetical protein
MIKHINHQNVTTTPFVAAKSRVLSNVQNPAVVKAEPDLYPDGTLISLDYVDYNLGDPLWSRDCNVALEQQEIDAIGYEEGITGSGQFDPATEAQNPDGTYKSLVHRTTKNTFYNTYNNPTEIFGVEHIDFPLSKTLRNLSDKFRMFSLQQLQFGDKIKPNSVRFSDNLLDDNVTIFDDGYQNLIGGYNLFSRVQEIRSWPSGTNPQWIITGSITSSCKCPVFDDLDLTNPPNIYAEYGANVAMCVSSSGNPRPIAYQWYSGSDTMSDGGQISGSQGPCLYINSVNFSNQATYSVRAHNNYSLGGTQHRTSSVAYLYIIPHPPVVSDPQDQYVYTGFSASFQVTASGATPMWYQWYSGSVALADNSRITGSQFTGSGTSSLIINNVDYPDSGYYHVVATNIFGTDTSNPALLTVLDNFIPVSASDTSSFGLNTSVGLRFGSLVDGPPTVEPSTLALFGASFITGSIFELVVTASSPPETASMNLGFGSGYTFSVVTTAYGGNETASMQLGFEGGYLFTVVVPTYGGYETASLSMGFEGGFTQSVVITTGSVEVPTYLSVGFLSGSIQ